MNRILFSALALVAMGTTALAGHSHVTTNCCDPPTTYAPQTVAKTHYEMQTQTRTRQVPHTVVEQEEYTVTEYVPQQVTKTRDVCRTEYTTEEYQVNVCVPVTTYERQCVPVQTCTQTCTQSTCCTSNQCNNGFSAADIAELSAVRALDDAMDTSNGGKRMGCFKRFLAKRAVKRLIGRIPDEGEPTRPTLPTFPGEPGNGIPIELPISQPAPPSPEPSLPIGS